MIEMGFEDINQLEGGILNYLEEIDDKDNLWQGECFVFDDRVAVDNELSDGNYIQCHACRNPLALDEIESEDYIEGISCPKCIDKISEDRLRRFKERQKQIDLANKRGEKHIGKIIIVDPDLENPEEFLRQVAEALQQGGMRCVVVRGKGSYAVGADLDQAWANAAMLEHSMKIVMLARQANLKV